VKASGTLYVVGTPIGNLDDMSDRVRRTLTDVAVCFAEDTRRTGRLLGRIGSSVKLRSLHAHNEEARTREILDCLSAGQSIALVSDAGTPGVSDPGRRSVAAVRTAGFPVMPVPGPSAVPTALSVSGLPADRFLFAGFAPRKGKARSEWFDEVERSPVTVVMFEAPGRLGDLLAALSERGLGERHVVVCRELTKLHEEIRSGTATELATVYRDETVKGEVTVVMEGCGPEPAPEFDAADVLAVALEMRDAGEGQRAIAAALRERFGLTRNEAYRMSLGPSNVDGHD